MSQALLEAASHSKEEKKLIKSGHLLAAHSEKRLVALRNAESRIRELQDMLTDESGARKEESAALLAPDATIQELEDTIIKLQGDVDNMPPRIVNKMPRKSGGCEQICRADTRRRRGNVRRGRGASVRDHAAKVGRGGIQ